MNEISGKQERVGLTHLLLYRGRRSSSLILIAKVIPASTHSLSVCMASVSVYGSHLDLCVSVFLC